MPDTASQTKEERIDLRTTRRVKERIQRAAEVLGTSVSAFVVHHAYEAAQRLLQEQEALVLTDRERDQFLAMLDSPPEPTDTLRRLLASGKRLQ
jgi:uncharacterized protein (DUF1778 family)